MHAHLPVLRHGRAAGRRHAAGRAGADAAARRPGAVPAEEHAAPARLAGQQLLLPAAAGDGAGRRPGALPERERAARPRSHALRAGRARRRRVPRRQRRLGLLAARPATRHHAGAGAGRNARSRPLPRGCRRRAQRRACAARHRHGRQELPQPLAGGGHQGQGCGRRPAPPAVLQLHLRPGLPDRELRAAERPPPLRVHADAGADARAHGAPGHGASLPVEVHRRRQVPGPAHAGLHLQRADGRALARRPRAAGRRRRAHDAAVHRPGHERRCARCLQPGLEARRGAARPGGRRAAGQLRARAPPARRGDDARRHPHEGLRVDGQPAGHAAAQCADAAGGAAAEDRSLRAPGRFHPQADLHERPATSASAASAGAAPKAG